MLLWLTIWLQIVDGQVATEDALSNEVGRIVRVKNLNAMKEMVIPLQQHKHPGLTIL